MERIRIIFSSLAAVLVLVLTTGCANTLPKTVAKKGIRNIAVKPEIAADQGLRYGVDLSNGQLVNSLSSSIVDATSRGPVQRMSAVMTENKILVNEMVHQQVRKKLAEEYHLSLVDSSAEATLSVTIMQYGYDNPGLWASRKCPIILFRGELRDRNGKRIWWNKNKPIQLTFSDGIGATWEEYEKNPEKLRQDWTHQIDNMLNKLLNRVNIP